MLKLNYKVVVFIRISNISLVLINPGPSLSLPIVCIIPTLQMKEMEAKMYQDHISKDGES